VRRRGGPKPAARHDESRIGDRALLDAFIARGLEDRSPRLRRNHRVRVAILAVAVLLPLSGGTYAVGTKFFWAEERPAYERDPGAGFELSPGDVRPGRATARDPRDARIWGLRLSYNKKAESCVLLGVVGPRGALGVQGAGRFKRYADGAAGACHDMADHLFVTSRTYDDLPDTRTVLYGLTDNSIRRDLTLRTSDGRTHRIRAAPDGSFLLPLVGKHALSGARLSGRGDGGTFARSLDPPRRATP
jgi:hypothetical protein